MRKDIFLVKYVKNIKSLSFKFCYKSNEIIQPFVFNNLQPYKEKSKIYIQCTEKPTTNLAGVSFLLALFPKN